jgi:hypothetical protein
VIRTKDYQTNLMDYSETYFLARAIENVLQIL